MSKGLVKCQTVMTISDSFIINNIIYSIIIVGCIGIWIHAGVAVKGHDENNNNYICTC